MHEDDLQDEPSNLTTNDEKQEEAEGIDLERREF